MAEPETKRLKELPSPSRQIIVPHVNIVGNRGTKRLIAGDSMVDQQTKKENEAVIPVEGA